MHKPCVTSQRPPPPTQSASAVHRFRAWQVPEMHCWFAAHALSCEHWHRSAVQVKPLAHSESSTHSGGALQIPARHTCMSPHSLSFRQIGPQAPRRQRWEAVHCASVSHGVELTLGHPDNTTDRIISTGNRMAAHSNHKSPRVLDALPHAKQPSMRAGIWLIVIGTLSACAQVIRPTREPLAAPQPVTPPTPGGPFDFSSAKAAPDDAGYVWDMSHPGKVPGYDTRAPVGGAPIRSR